MIEATLIDMEEDGGVLVLLDGRKLVVCPSYIMTSRVWLLPLHLQIVDDASEPHFPLKCAQHDNGYTRRSDMEIESSRGSQSLPATVHG